MSSVASTSYQGTACPCPPRSSSKIKIDMLIQLAAGTYRAPVVVGPGAFSTSLVQLPS